MSTPNHQDALNTLLNVRRRLADRLAQRINHHVSTLVANTVDHDDPIAATPELNSICFGLTRVNNAIASLRAVLGVEPRRTSMAAHADDHTDSTSASPRHGESSSHARTRSAPAPQTTTTPIVSAAPPHSSDRAFEQIREHVLAERFEDASRRLANLLRMPVDRAFTATRFFGRALQQDVTIPEQLARLCDEIETMPASQVMKTLVHAFGLQAVESGAAMTALRDRRRALGNTGLAAPTPSLTPQLTAAPPFGAF